MDDIGKIILLRLALAQLLHETEVLEANFETDHHNYTPSLARALTDAKMALTKTSENVE